MAENYGRGVVAVLAPEGYEARMVEGVALYWRPQVRRAGAPEWISIGTNHQTPDVTAAAGQIADWVRISRGEHQDGDFHDLLDALREQRESEHG